jgi:hypothetical protein
MKKIQRYFSTPILLLGICILAYGIQAVWLGYTLDDWVFLYHIYRGGYERLAAYSFGVNRPFGAWPWWIGFKLFGYTPILWHFWSLTLRWLTSIFLWMSWKQIWPEKKLQISLACALFLVYPVFLQQTAAVTFSDHWMCFALFAFSIFLMVFSFKNQRLYFPLTGLALLFSGLQLFTIEYFIGLELIRPLLLWFVFADIEQRKTRFKKAALAELPYAMLLGVFLAWRFLFMPTPGFDRNKPEILYGVFTKPLQTIGTLGVKGLQDIVEALLGTWYKTYNPATLTPAPVSNLLSWGIMTLAVVLAMAFFFFLAKKEPEAELARKNSYEWIAVSFLVMIAGFLPSWSIGQFLVSSGNYSDRFGLAAMFGASLLIVSLSSYFLKQSHKILLICLLIGLATGYQFRLANQYRWAWESQSRLAWQLAWRVPGLKLHTAVYGDGTLANGSWVDVAWLNFLYGKPGEQKTEDTWYFDLNKFQDSAPAQNQPIAETRFEHLTYVGNTSDSVVIQFKSVKNQCLWVVREGDLLTPFLNPKVIDALPLSNMQRITPMEARNPYLETIFLPEPVHEWCYYYEKAALAVENKEWEVVKNLWQEASAQKLKTGVAAEYLPFIYGVASAGDLETALGISTRAKSIELLMQEPLCQTWDKIFENSGEAQDIKAMKQTVADKLGCP